MLEFKKPEIEDKKWADECFKYVNSFNCEYTFGNLFIWSTAYRTEIAHYKNFLMCRWGKAPDYLYSAPIGSGDFKDAVEAVIRDAAQNGIQPKLYGITQNYKALLDEYFPGKFTYTYDEGDFDYIYSVEKMAELRGKKYHSKRNHITNFKKNNPDWSFETINRDNLNECVILHTDWIKNHQDDADYSFEFEAVLTALENYEALGFTGGILRIGGEAVAYTIGERHSDELFVTHFEKAPADIQGAYPIINQEFTRNCLMSYKFVNREEDMGIEGLRKAKQSYNPEIFLKKGVAAYNA